MLAISPAPISSSDWFSYIPNLFRKSPSNEEPLDLADEEMDADEALGLMLGLPRDLRLPPVALPPKAITTIKKPTSPTFKPNSTSKPLSINVAPPSELRRSPLRLPSGISSPKKTTFDRETSTKVLDLSFKKLRASTRKQRRPLHQTLLIHRTISLVKSIKRSSNPPKTLKSNVDVARPQPAVCRESAPDSLHKSHSHKLSLANLPRSVIKAW